MKTKIDMISWLVCISSIVCLVTLIIGIAIGNDVLVHISLFAGLFITIVGGFILKALVIIYDSQENGENKHARF